MSAKPGSLEHVLARKGHAKLDLDLMSTGDLKQVARFWFGTTAANKLRSADGPGVLKQVFQDRKRMADALRSLPEKERQVLAVCMRYGGSISGSLLLTELLARGVVEKPKERNFFSGRRDTEDPVARLRGKLLLVSPLGRYSRYDSYHYSYRLSYPDLEVLPAVHDLIEPAAVQPWAPSAPSIEPTATSNRVAAEVVLDLWTTAQALGQAKSWKANRGGSLPKSMQNRLGKLFSWPDNDPLLPPSLESLGYEILRGLGVVQVDEQDQGSIDLEAVERHLRGSAVVQAWHWVRAWIESRLWQDGIGVVPDRDSDYNPQRIEPGKLRTARELLVWALGRVAHGTDDWLDLETFLADLWSLAGEEMDFYWSGYSWDPEFNLSRDRDDLPRGPERMRAFWMETGGTWAGNALLGTLAYLGLVERGRSGTGRKTRHSFRLTGLGKAVFGAPDLALPAPALDPKFLTVQPNHEVILYLDAADASTVWPLAQMARRTSSGGGLVQTFALTRESVYEGLESGLTVAEIRQFLLEHSKTGLPANVGQSLTEWGQRREALVLRTDVLIAAFPSGDSSGPQRFPKGRSLGDQFLLLPRTAARRQKDDVLLDHRDPARPVFRIEEDGRVSVLRDADAIALARLGQFAEGAGKEWKITAGSVRRARERGIPAEQVLGWLQEHLANALPPIMETAIRNWSSPSVVALGDLVVLQVPQPQACAMILSSPRFQPLLLGHVPPNWFIVHPEKRQQLEQLLAELGFLARGSYQFAALAEEAADRVEEPRKKARKGRRGREK